MSSLPLAHRLKKIGTAILTLALFLTPLSLPSSYAAFGAATAASITLGGTAVSGATGTSSLTFTAGTTIPVGGSITITLPADFTAGNVTNVIPNITAFTDDGISVSANIFSASLTSNVITLTTQTAAIAATSVVIISFDATIIDTNPATAGQYGVQITTKDATGAMLDTGMATASIANSIAVVATIQQALVATLGSTALNFNADPSVNNGRDTSQYSKLTVRTNANTKYAVDVRLTSTGGEGTLYNTAATHALAGTNDSDTNNDATPDIDNYVNFKVYGARAETTTNELNFSSTDAQSSEQVNENTIADANARANNTEIAYRPFNTTTTPINVAEMAMTDAAHAAAGDQGRKGTNGDEVFVNYDLNVDYTTPAGSYTGTITYTITPTF